MEASNRQRLLEVSGCRFAFLKVGCSPAGRARNRCKEERQKGREEQSHFPVSERKNKKREKNFEMARVAAHLVSAVCTIGIRNQRFASKLLSLCLALFSLFRLLISIFDRPNERAQTPYGPDGRRRLDTPAPRTYPPRAISL